MLNRKRVAAALVLTAALAPLLASAQSYPTKPLRAMVNSGPGSGADVLCRTFSEYLAQQLGQNVLVENRPGGNGVIGVDAAIKSPADGYTLLCAGGGNMAPGLHKSLPWDFLVVVDPVVQVFKLGLFLTVSGKLL